MSRRSVKSVLILFLAFAAIFGVSRIGDISTIYRSSDSTSLPPETLLEDGHSGGAGDPKEEVLDQEFSNELLGGISAELPGQAIRDVMRSKTSLLPYLEQYQQRAASGYADAQYLFASILEYCAPLEEQFSGESLSSLMSRMSLQDPKYIAWLNDSFQMCHELIERGVGSFGDSEYFRMSSYEQDFPLALVDEATQLASNFAKSEEIVPLLERAISSADPASMFESGIIAFDLLEDNPEKALGLIIAACSVGVDCSYSGPMMSDACRFNENCSLGESFVEFVIRDSQVSPSTVEKAQIDANRLISAMRNNEPIDFRFSAAK